VPALLAAADIHCQPNTGPEPFGIAVRRGAGRRAPGGDHAAGAAPEILTAACGVLVEPGDPAALAAALAALIADGAARARLGAAGPARARALCDPAAVAARLRQRVAELLGTEDRAARTDPRPPDPRPDPVSP
jgi:glycosyltransferase involved in cell wall biosynthesis